jgi:hypothetical protein
VTATNHRSKTVSVWSSNSFLVLLHELHRGTELNFLRSLMVVEIGLSFEWRERQFVRGFCLWVPTKLPVSGNYPMEGRRGHPLKSYFQFLVLHFQRPLDILNIIHNLMLQQCAIIVGQCNHGLLASRRCFAAGAIFCQVVSQKLSGQVPLTVLLKHARRALNGAMELCSHEVG